MPQVYDNQGNVINWDGGGYRLPTEAEWEYACRAGTTTKYSSDDVITVQQANYDPNLGKKHPWFRARSMPVKSLPPNQFGLYDMHGNLWEWCQDYYGPYTANDATNPVGPAQGTAHVIRGGSWWNAVDSARSAKRYDLGAQPMFPQCMGFRCVRSAK
ncbi:MAG: SUMF1/EgtB/PvdO family nonheme iron enzyme [bacterium]|nr:SUMF1/EgtB/PvdO family nonheme iron enzyme [bacterium]